MEPYKIAWLKTFAVCMEDVVDCDPVQQTVTFKNGDTRQLVEVYTRVMGYHARVSAHNAGKQQEHKDRKFFRESAIPARYTLAEGEGCPQWAAKPAEAVDA